MIKTIKKILTISIVGILIAGGVNAYFSQYWKFNQDLDCRTAGTCDITGIGTMDVDVLDVATMSVSKTFLLEGVVGTGGIDLNGENIALNGGYVSGDGDDEGLYVDSSGNVGIGTTSPGNTLHVYKDASIGGFGSLTLANAGLRVEDSSISAYFDGNTWVSDGSGNLNIGTVNEQDINFGTNDTTRMTIADNGDMGIGDTTPDAMLEVVTRGDTDVFNLSRGASGDGDLMTVTAEGLVGIGTTSPEAKLHVGESTGANILLNRQQGSGVLVDYLLGQILFDSSDGGVSSVDAPVMIRAYAAEAQGSNNKGGYLTFETKAKVVPEEGEATERMRIDSSGNVGIGTTSPGALLHIRQPATADSSPIEALRISMDDGDLVNMQAGMGSKISFYMPNNEDTTSFEGAFIASVKESATDNNDDTALIFGTTVEGGTVTEQMRIDKDGNVGIGTTSPNSELEVSSDTENAYIYINSPTEDDSGIHFRENNVKKWGIYNDGSDSNKFKIADDGDIRLIIQQDGNVGIGTTSPDSKLEVVGDIQITDTSPALKFVDSTADADSFNIQVNSNRLEVFSGDLRNIINFMGESDANAGNVGIGTESPGYKLEVLAVTTQLVLTHTDGVDETQFSVDSNGDLRIEPSGGDVVVDAYIRPTKIWHAYGGFQDQSETLDIGVETWTHVTNSGNDLWTGIESDGLTLVDDEMVITNAGDYTGSMSVTFEGGQSKDYIFRIYNVTQSAQAGYKIGATGQGNGNYTNVTVPIYLEANAGDTFQFQVYTADGTDADFINSIFELHYLHE